MASKWLGALLGLMAAAEKLGTVPDLAVAARMPRDQKKSSGAMPGSVEAARKPKGCAGFSETGKEGVDSPFHESPVKSIWRKMM